MSESYLSSKSDNGEFSQKWQRNQFSPASYVLVIIIIILAIKCNRLQSHKKRQRINIDCKLIN